MSDDASQFLLLIPRPDSIVDSDLSTNHETCSKWLVEANDKGDKTRQKKRKPEVSWDAGLLDDETERTKAFYTRKDELGVWLAGERQDMNDELEAGSHILMLEHNSTWTAKCRALECVIRDHQRCDGRICSPYRFNLQATKYNNAHWSQLDKPNRRFFHISCFEAIGVNVAQYLTLPRPQIHRTVRGFVVSSDHFHPAIIDWLANAGKAFDAHRYEEYADALERYQGEKSTRRIKHSLRCLDGQCACGSPPVTNDRREFFGGHPSKRDLSDVLLQTLRVASHKPAPYWLLEILGDVSSISSSRSPGGCQETQVGGNGESWAQGKY